MGTHWREGLLRREREPVTEEKLQMVHGEYCGATIGGNWKPYLRRGWIMRGLADLWLDGQDLCFRRDLTRMVMRIPLPLVVSASTTYKHAFQIHLNPAALVHWVDGGRDLRASFAMRRSYTEPWARMVLRLAAWHKGGEARSAEGERELVTA